MKIIKSSLNIIELLAKTFFYIGAVSMLIMFFLIFFDITLRFAINLPVEGTDIFASYLMVAIGFLALGYGELIGAHVKMEYFGNIIFKSNRKYLELFVLLIVIIFFTIMTWQVAKRAQADMVNKILTPNSSILLQVWWQNAIAAAGCGMLVVSLIIEFLRKSLRLVIGLSKKQCAIYPEKQGA